MLSEESIRSIAERATTVMTNGSNRQERTRIVENAIREALMMDNRRCLPLEPNAGCL